MVLSDAPRSVQPTLLRQLLQSQDGRIRSAAVRVLSHWKFLIPESMELLRGLVQDGHPRVRLEAIRAISFSPLQDSERQLADGSAFLKARRRNPQRRWLCTRILV